METKASAALVRGMGCGCPLNKGAKFEVTRHLASFGNILVYYARYPEVIINSTSIHSQEC